MLTGAMVLGLFFLLWAALTLYDIRAMLGRIVSAQNCDPKQPDSGYPAFSRDEINHAYIEIQTALKKSLEAERRWYTSEGWKEIDTKSATPTDADKEAVRDVFLHLRLWELALRGFQFLVEANLRVQRGEWTIAQARFCFNELENTWKWGEWDEWQRNINNRVNDWFELLSSMRHDKDIFDRADYEEQTQILRDRLEKQSKIPDPYDEARAAFLTNWRKQFDAMHDRKQQFVSPMPPRQNKKSDILCARQQRRSPAQIFDFFWTAVSESGLMRLRSPRAGLFWIDPPPRCRVASQSNSIGREQTV